MTVKRLLSELSSFELTEWQAYYMLQQEYANGKKPGAKPIDAEGFRSAFSNLVVKKKK